MYACNVISQSTPEPIIIQIPTPTIELEAKEENIIEEVNQEETGELDGSDKTCL